ncbi:hypothetical protein KR018_002537, partial [Drosophila ironensis]
NEEQVTPVSTAQTPGSSGVGSKCAKKKVAATTAPPIPSQTTATTVASSQSGSAPEQTQAPPTLDLLERIASLEKELEQLRASSANHSAPRTYGEGGVGNAAAHVAPPSWIGPPYLPTSSGIPYNGVSMGSTVPVAPPSWSGPTLLASSSHQAPYCATSTAQAAHGLAPPGVSIHNTWTPTPIAGSHPWMTPNSGYNMPRKLPDLPVFGGQPEDWPIFYCAFTETTQAYNCTDLENNQRLLKALKDEARDTVKSLLIHPRNVSAAVEQLRFRYGRPEQLVRSQLNSIREVPHISEHNYTLRNPREERSRGVDCCMQALTTTKASNRIGPEVVPSVKDNMQSGTAGSLKELRHRIGGHMQKGIESALIAFKVDT